MVVQAVSDKVSSEQKHVLAPLVAGATSGLVASLIRVPTEVVKQRMQSGELNICELHSPACKTHEILLLM